VQHSVPLPGRKRKEGLMGQDSWVNRQFRLAPLAAVLGGQPHSTDKKLPESVVLSGPARVCPSPISARRADWVDAQGCERLLAHNSLERE
jgi:hypothetical protein